MFGIKTLGGSTRAAALAGVVLVEAMVLYVGCGVLTVALGPTVRETIGGE